MTAADKWITVEGDKPKVERTRKHFAAIFAGLKTAEEYAREQTLENEALSRRVEELEARLGREQVRVHEEVQRWQEAELRATRLAEALRRIEAYKFSPQSDIARAALSEAGPEDSDE